MRTNANADVLNSFLLWAVSHNNIDVIYVPNDTYVHGCFYHRDPTTNRLDSFNVIILAEKKMDFHVSIPMNTAVISKRKHVRKTYTFSCHGLSADIDLKKGELHLLHSVPISKAVIETSDLVFEWIRFQLAISLIEKNNPDYF